MSRQLALSMQRGKPSRSERKREELKEEIMRFAARVRPRISSGRDSWVHTEISTLMNRMKTSEIAGFKKRIQRGEEDGLFPGSRILEKEGEGAAEVAGFLGTDYVGLMLRLARSRGDVHNVAFGKQYLEWAATHGSGRVKTRALAGIALVAADEVADGNGDFIERELIKKRGSMRVLSRSIGENEAWGIVREAMGWGEIRKKVISATSFMAGICAGATALVMQGITEQRGPEVMQLIAVGGSATAGIALGLSFIGKASIGAIQKSISRLLNKPPQDGHV